MGSVVFSSSTAAIRSIEPLERDMYCRHIATSITAVRICVIYWSNEVRLPIVRPVPSIIILPPIIRRSIIATYIMH